MPVASGREGATQLAGGAVVTLVRRPFAASEAGALFRALRSSTPWPKEKPQLAVGSTKAEEPRLVCYQAQSHELAFSCTTGAILRPACAFDANVCAVLAKLRVIFPTAPEFNTCVLNYYRDGTDSMPWHADQDFTRYGSTPVVASVSFGSERLFQMRQKADHGNRVEFNLGSGAALLMSGSCQATWQHCVPRRATTPGGRINLTFRRVLEPGER